MPQAKGKQGRLVIDFEDTLGAAPAIKSAKNMPFMSLGIKGSQALNESAVITGGRHKAKPFLGNMDVSGNMTVPVDIRSFGYWLKALLGAPVTTGSNPYAHTFKPLNEIPSLVVEKGFTDIGQYYLYSGVKANTMSLSFGGDGELTAELGFIGISEELSETAYESNPPMLVFEGYKNFQVAIKENGTALVGLVTELKVSIENGIDDSMYPIGSLGKRSELPEGEINVSGSLTAMFRDGVLVGKAINNTETSIEIVISDGTNSISMLIPEIIYDRTSPDISGPKGVVVSLSFRAYLQDNADNTTIKVVLTNDVNEY